MLNVEFAPGHSPTKLVPCALGHSNRLVGPMLLVLRLCAYVAMTQGQALQEALA